ncbi:hypothetical protein GCM10010145_61930 [Streptomyces ruber]|uniref:Uncharacterized protein n=2 Tax=Streptomyces TaxID=1883 RepID=A0A918EZ78_9ACTN|nr:hypothetical protein GCM10010145_61930 [Streptomyces ruber]
MEEFLVRPRLVEEERHRVHVLDTDACVREAGLSGVAGEAVRVFEPVESLLFDCGNDLAIPNEYRRRVVKEPLGKAGYDFAARQREAAIQSEGIHDSPLDGDENARTLRAVNPKTGKCPVNETTVKCVPQSIGNPLMHFRTLSKSPTP